MRRLDRASLEPWALTHPHEVSSYHAPANPGDDPGPDVDFPLDDFDKQILAEQVPIRYSLPSYSHASTGQGQERWSVRNDAPRAHRSPVSSSSSTFPFSSPTPLAAKKNRDHGSQRSKAAASTSRFRDQPLLSDDVAQTKDQFQRNVPKSALPRSLQLAHVPPTIQDIPLISTDRLPDNLRSIFDFPIFNAVQSKCFATAYESNDNLVVSAPTGSGKTAIMELALCRLLLTAKNHDFKVVYQAPTKSLCSERCRDWKSKFQTLGLQCAELTGDMEHAQLRTVQSAHIIVTTPEKWDSVTRKWKDNAKLVSMIKLFLVDEVHILNESRGATLEAVVSRMKSTGTDIRFIALSATVPNSDDIATWLGRDCGSYHLPARRAVFDEAFRPVALEKHVVGYNSRPNEFALDSLLTKEMPSMIARHANRKPVMIFCMTKKSAITTAAYLEKIWTSTTDHLRLWAGPTQQLRVTNSELRKMTVSGVAFHHGGLDADDRRTIEEGFRHGDINVVCSTSTLAVGVNLPCYLVILKGTSCWTDNGLQEYSSLEVMQMLGRAGRPQYETSACALILTDNSKVRRYEEMVSGQEVLESSLHENLIEHLNAEIGIGTIHDIGSAKQWLASSFLSVRLKQNPSHYRLDNDNSTEDADQLLGRICERDLNLLEEARLIEHRQRLRCTEYGYAMARYYVHFQTMILFMDMPKPARISDILNTLAGVEEFQNLKLRSGEKSLYKQVNKSNDIRFPIKVDIVLPAHKASLLIQAHLGSVMLEKADAKHACQFKQDTLAVLSHCNRLIRCIIDVQIACQDASAIHSALELCRSLAAGVWDNTPMQLKQIESVGEVTARKLAAAGIKSIDSLLSTEPHQLEMILSKTQPFGTMLLKKAARFPNLHVSVKEINKTRTVQLNAVDVRLRCEIGYLNETLPAYFNRKAVYVCFLCETSDGRLIDFRRFGANRLQNGEQILLTAILDKQCSSIHCHVMCDEIAGTHRQAELKLDIPEGWLPKEAEKRLHVNLEKGFAPVAAEPSTFDDAGLADDDFLAIECHGNDIDVIEGNIEDILSVASQADVPGNALKRKAPVAKTVTCDSATAKVLRESEQLPNGKWTCQHSCNAEGKDCKHHCCKEGVKRPKKRVKSHNCGSGNGGSIREAFTNANVTATIGHGQPLRETVNLDNSTHGATSRRFDGKDSSTGDVNDGVRKTACVVDIDDLDSDDLPSVSTFMSKPEACDNAVRKEAEHVDDQDSQTSIFDVSDFGLDLDNCDWNFPNRISALDGDPRSGQDSTSEELQRDCLGSHVGIDNDDGFNGVTAVVRKDDQHDRMEATTVVPCPEFAKNQDIMVNSTSDYFDDVLDADLANLDTCIPPGIGTSPGWAKPKTVTLLNKQMEVCQAQNNAPAVSNPSPASPILLADNDQKRLHEEDQKRRWAQFPPWLFERFGAHVHLV